MPPSRDLCIINALRGIVDQIELFQALYTDEPYCNVLINDAKQKLFEALRSNEHEYNVAKQEAAEERRTMRAENGYQDA